MNKTLFITLLSLSLIQCQPAQDETTISNETNQAVEDAVTSLSDILDDQAGEAYAKAYNKMDFKELFLPKAWASQCQRPALQACNNQNKTSQLMDCEGAYGAIAMDGAVNLEYSTHDCSLNNDGDQINRTYNYNIIGPRGGIYAVSSDSHRNYKGVVVGGGGQLVKTPSGYEITILGKHKTYSKNNVRLYNTSIRTLSPLRVSGSLNRQARQIESGSIEVNHNVGRFTAVFSAENLMWSSSCCHPVSGRLNLEVSGARQGEGVVEFKSCGQATVTFNNESENVTFSHCE